MASYPNSVISFTTKSAGQTIQPNDVNDLQNEVMAIEAGLLNGTAPLNSSHSTLASLSVFGGSTLADLTIIAPPASVSVTSNTPIGVPNSVTTPILFNSERWLTGGGLHSTTTNPDRITPTSTGIYLISANALWSAGTSGFCVLTLAVDGSSQIASRTDFDIGTGSLNQSLETQYYFRTSTQYVQLSAFQTTGSTRSIQVAGDYSPVLTVTKMR